MSETPEPHPHRPEPARGIRQIGDPRVWGTIVGAAGGSVFVLANRGDLADPWPAVAVAAWAGALVAYVWFVLVARRELGPVGPVGRGAGLVYLGSVVGMVVLIRVGSVLLEHEERIELRPALIVGAVGLHFLPFAAAFHTALFKTLGSFLVVLGSVGIALGWTWRDHAAAGAAVVAGIVMLLVIAADAVATGKRRRHTFAAE